LQVAATIALRRVGAISLLSIDEERNDALPSSITVCRRLFVMAVMEKEHHSPPLTSGRRG
jgi:hypothetical protein